MMKLLNKRILISLALLLALLPTDASARMSQRRAEANREMLSLVWGSAGQFLDDVISGAFYVKNDIELKIAKAVNLAKAPSLPQLFYETKNLAQVVSQSTQSIDLASIKDELKSELINYINSQLENIQKPVIVYNTTVEQIDAEDLRNQIIIEDIKPTVTRQSDADSDRRSTVVSNLTDGGTFTSSTISGATITTSTFSGTTGTFTDLTVSGTCIGCGASFPFTTTSYGVSTSTTLAFTNGFLSTASSTFTSGFNFTTATGTSATSTNFFATTASSTNLFFTTGTAGNLTSSGLGTFTNILTNASSTFQNLTFLNSTSTNATTTSLFSTTASSTNLFSSLLTVGGTGLVVDSSRNVGIGTTTPQYKLSINSSNSTDNFFQIASTTNQGVFVVNSAGKVGIGQTTPVDRLHISSAFQARLRFTDDTTGHTATDGFVINAEGTTADFILYETGIMRFATGDTVRMTIESDGDVVISGSGTTCTIGNGTGATNCTSDVRLKENILDLESSLDKIMSLRPVTYNWIDKKKEQTTNIGFIAQEVQSLFPSAVHTVYEDYLGIDYANLVVPAIGAIQELNLNLESIASTTVSTSPLAASFAASFFENLFNRITTWLADAANGIGDLFANRVRTQELCVGSVCVTETELQELLDLRSQSAASGSVTITETLIDESSSDGGVASTDSASGESATSTDPVVETQTESATSTEPVTETETETATISEPVITEEPAPESQ